MNKREVSHLLRYMGSLLQIRGESPFKIRSYGKAADSIMAGDYDLWDMAVSGTLTEIPDVGVNLAPKIQELVLDGRSSFLERLMDEVPPGLLQVLDVAGIGPKTARILWTEHGVKDLHGLVELVESHKLQSLPGFGKKREETIAKGLLEVLRYAGRISVGRVIPAMDDLEARLRGRGILAWRAGEVRRHEETVAGLDVVMCKDAQESALQLVARTGLARESWDLERMYDAQLGCFTLPTAYGLPLRLHVCDRGSAAATLLCVTGPDEYLEFAKGRAASLGMDLTRDGLWKDRKKHPMDDESLLHEALGIPFTPPEVRHRPQVLATDVWRVVGPEHLRGDLHVHTNWSDGVATVEAMAQRAVSLGYSYLAITDHATEMKMIKGLDPETLREQIAEIKGVAERYPSIRLLAGVEVDIVKGGELFLPNESLAELDLVIASIHQDLEDSKGDFVDRLTKAAENPYVDIIGHPTGRLIGRRAGVQVGLEPFFQVAAQKGVALEINSSPERIDLSEDLAALAYRFGCSLAVSSDAHSVEGLEGLPLGVLASARRAALPPEAVVNTRDDIAPRSLRRRPG